MPTYVTINLPLVASLLALTHHPNPFRDSLRSSQDGGVKVPKVLQKYMGGVDVIKL